MLEYYAIIIYVLYERAFSNTYNAYLVITSFLKIIVNKNNFKTKVSVLDDTVRYLAVR